SISAGELTEARFSVEMERASSPGRLLSIRSSASASTVAGSIPGIAARIRRRRPTASAFRIGHEFGHSVPPTSMSATSRALCTAQMTAAKEGFDPKVVTRLRPGHADLAGALKYGHTDIRNVLERSSARETATRVAAGGVARKLLAHFGIDVISFTQSIGTVDI